MEMNENLVGMPELPDLPDIPNVEEDITEENVEANVDETETTEESSEELLGEENPLNDFTLKQLSDLLSQVGDMVKTMEQNWLMSKKEFDLNDTQMKQLWDYNKEHRTTLPEDDPNITEEERENWDQFNGLNEIPEEKVFEIFGEGHPIIGVMNSQTIDRIKNVVSDFFGWLDAIREYKKINEAYMKLVEIEEEKEIQKLIDEMNTIEDPDRKAALGISIKTYYDNKLLNFLAEPLTEMEIDRLVKAYYDKKKIEYWINRSRDRLKQLKIAPKCILEISQFEKRFLPEKYHKQSNIFLLYFMTVLIHCDPNSKNDINKTRTISMILVLDSVIRNTIDPEKKKVVLDNMMKFQDQFMDRITESNDEEGNE